MVYSLVTDKRYIPTTKNGTSNFIVLESDNTSDQKNVYILIPHISSIEMTPTNIIKIVVDGNSTYEVKKSFRESLFQIINTYLDDSDSDSDSNINGDK